MNTVMKRLRVLGILLLVAGLAVAGVGLLYGAATASDGLASAQAMYEAQGVTLSYNEEGEFVDRGSPEQGTKILALLEEDWKYPLDRSNLDPADPLINTRDELMVQYATITYHILTREVAVTLGADDVPITYRGVTYEEPGEYRIAVGAYFAELDRSHPIEGQLRAAWDPMALALLGSLAGGHANQAAGELALMTSLGMAGMGLLFAVAGAGLVWVSLARPAHSAAPAKAATTNPHAAGRSAPQRVPVTVMKAPPRRPVVTIGGRGEEPHDPEVYRNRR